MRSLITSASVVPRLSHFRFCRLQIKHPFTQTRLLKSSFLGLRNGNLLNQLRTAPEVNIKGAFSKVKKEIIADYSIPRQKKNSLLKIYYSGYTNIRNKVFSSRLLTS